MSDVMQYVRLDAPGGPEKLVLATTQKPQPGPGEVLIRVEAAGVNRPDILQRRGDYPPPQGASPILGLEVAGVIEKLGENVSLWKKGDRVCALVAGGGYAEFCVAPEGQCLPIPSNISSIEAAGIPETFFTVWFNVFMRGRLKAGESILIHGGTSGIGTAAIQLATAFGAVPFATAGSREKCEACIKLGATGAVDYKKEDFVEAVRGMTRGRGVDMILDMVGGDYLPRNVSLLANEGRLVQIAIQGGAEGTLPLWKLMAKGLTITGSTLRPRGTTEKAEIASALRERVWPLLESNRVRVVIDKVFPFFAVADAHQRMEGGTHIGKVILTLADLPPGQ